MTPEEEKTLDQLIYGYDACGSPMADLLRELKQRRQDMAGLDAGTHVVVPREPTGDMCIAGAKQTAADGFSDESAYRVYRAMLAQSPPQGEVWTREQIAAVNKDADEMRARIQPLPIAEEGKPPGDTPQGEKQT